MIGRYFCFFSLSSLLARRPAAVYLIECICDALDIKSITVLCISFFSVSAFINPSHLMDLLQLNWKQMAHNRHSKRKSHTEKCSKSSINLCGFLLDPVSYKTVNGKKWIWLIRRKQRILTAHFLAAKMRKISAHLLLLVSINKCCGFYHVNFILKCHKTCTLQPRLQRMK